MRILSDIKRGFGTLLAVAFVLGIAGAVAYGAWEAALGLIDMGLQGLLVVLGVLIGLAVCWAVGRWADS